MFKSTVGALLIACAALLTVVAPAAARTGRVGAYSLTDTQASAGETAKYRYFVSSRPGEDHWQLHRLVVRPPNMKAVAGNSNQTVGWSFTVQRIECFEPPCLWEDRYTSPVYTAVTSDTANAPFGKESVSVRVPSQIAALVHYRTFVRMFWYAPGGGVQGTAKALVHYTNWVRPGLSDSTQDSCPGGIYGG